MEENEFVRVFFYTQIQRCCQENFSNSVFPEKICFSSAFSAAFPLFL